MMTNWNSVVKPGDIVIHLGDFALTSLEHMKDILRKLNGDVFIILGNHDKSRMRMAEVGFIVVDGSLIIGNLIFTHRPMHIVPKECVNIHGHIHEKETSGNRINLCVEKTDYKPVLLSDVRKYA